MSMESNLAQIRVAIEKTLKNSPLAAKKPVILAASKGQNTVTIEKAIGLGISVFGENRVQEAYEKWPELKKTHKNISLHLIGPLQTNKVKDALALFDVIQTLDRPKLAEVLSAELRVLSKEQSQHSALGTRHFYIQINTGEEPQKGGVIPADVDEFIKYCRDELKLPVIGLMCIPPADQPPAAHFAMLREIALRHNLAELSMGMSSDYETALRMGSTCIRIGTMLFGERK